MILKYQNVKLLFPMLFVTATLLNNNASAAVSYPYCTNGSNTGNGFGWDPAVRASDGTHSCKVKARNANVSYPDCTNGSNTGNGFGWDPSVTASDGTHSCIVNFDSAPDLNVHAPGNVNYHFNDYGNDLGFNKRALGKAIDEVGATLQEKIVLIAIAMIESTHMTVHQRDFSKDGLASENVSVFNMNIDMPVRLGYRGPFRYLNDPSNQKPAISIMLKASRTWGLERMLNFHRGGYTGFMDGVSFGTYDYRNVIKTMYNIIKNDPSLLNDNRRIEIWLQGV